jgi:diguanylate cyclase (GGDEF)-like protein
MPGPAAVAAALAWLGDGMSRRFPAQLDAEACQAQAQALLASASPQDTPMKPALELAWTLRQVDSRLAAQLARACIAQTPGPDATACALLVLAEAAWLEADLARAQAKLAAAQALLGPTGPPRALSDLHWLRSQLAAEAGQARLRDEAIADSLAAARAAGDVLRVAQGRLALACLAAIDGQGLDGDAAATVHAGLAADDPCLRMLAHLAQQHIAMRAQDTAGAIAHGEVAISAAKACGQWRRAIFVSCNIGLELHDRHALDEALARLDATLPLARRCGWPLPLGSILHAMAECLNGLGRHAAAADLAGEACALADRLPLARTRLTGLIALGNALRHLPDRADDAESVYLRAEQAAAAAGDEVIGRYARYGRAWLRHARGDTQAAWPLAEAALAHALQQGDLAHAALCLRLQAALAATPGARIDAGHAGASPRQLLERARTLLPPEPDMAESHALLAELARATQAEGDVGAAGAHWRAAYEALAVQRSREFNDRAAATEVRLRTEQALARARVERELSLRDPLTQLHNRRFFDAMIERCVADARAASADGHLLFVMVDIDRFKAINDRHGHAAGDAVLVQFAQRLRSVARAQDHLVRWGGEEFLLLLNAASRADGEVVAQRLLQEITGRSFELPGGLLAPVSCSIGWCAFAPGRASPAPATWHDALALADARLYEAKRAGRNRAVG